MATTMRQAAPIYTMESEIGFFHPINGANPPVYRYSPNMINVYRLGNAAIQKERLPSGRQEARPPAASSQRWRVRTEAGVRPRRASATKTVSQSRHAKTTRASDTQIFMGRRFRNCNVAPMDMTATGTTTPRATSRVIVMSRRAGPTGALGIVCVDRAMRDILSCMRRAATWATLRHVPARRMDRCDVDIVGEHRTWRQEGCSGHRR